MSRALRRRSTGPVVALALALASFVACAPSGSATPVREPAPVDSSGGAAPANVDPARCAKVHTDELVEGVGSCSVDADCELSSYQPGCCTQACAPSAKSRADLARAKGAESCEALKKRQPLCPPPAACQPPTYQPIAALCCGGTCMTARRLLP